jgi:hypothetical protein
MKAPESYDSGSDLALLDIEDNEVMNSARDVGDWSARGHAVSAAVNRASDSARQSGMLRSDRGGVPDVAFAEGLGRAADRLPEGRVVDGLLGLVAALDRDLDASVDALDQEPHARRKRSGFHARELARDAGHAAGGPVRREGLGVGLLGGALGVVGL